MTVDERNLRNNSDIVCYDCSYNNIEFAMGREKDLFTINDYLPLIIAMLKRNLKNITIL